MMMTRAASKAARSIMTGKVLPRYFSTTISSAGAGAGAILRTNETAAFKLFNGACRHEVEGSSTDHVPVGLIRMPPRVRYKSTTSLQEERKDNKEAASSGAGADDNNGSHENAIVIQPKKILKDDGTEWKWSCFMVCLYS